MHGLPPDIDLTFFHNQKLIQVCIGANDLILHFDDDFNVVVTSLIGCENAGGIVHKLDDFRKAASFVSELIDQVVTQVQGHPDGTLRLEFEGGNTLLIYDDSKQFESYLINYKGTVIVV